MATPNIHESWKAHLNDEFRKPYWDTLTSFVKHEYATHVCYPPGKFIFSAFDHCSFDDVRVVILGQDPYHGPGQANGLCFSVNEGIKPPPSLVNIFKELKSDLDISIPVSGNLERWADQGVLLLNATLTVRENAAGSHQNKGWETFTDAVIRVLNADKENVVFLLWGAYAHKKGSMIDTSKHLVLKSAHPSPLSAHNGWWGNKHFSSTNDFMKSKGLKEINW